MDGIKLFMVASLLAIVASLGKGMFHMAGNSTDVQRSAQMVRALTVRISLSVGLFLVLLVTWYIGALKPHGVG